MAVFFVLCLLFLEFAGCKSVQYRTKSLQHRTEFVKHGTDSRQHLTKSVKHRTCFTYLM